MIVVADAGPLIHLASIGQLDLLRRLAPDIAIPEAVYQEVVVIGAGLPGEEEVRSAPWLRVAALERREVVNALCASGLHLGESEAIALALELRATWLVIDERQGRLTADAMGLQTVGTLGVLVAARERGEVARLAPLLDALRASGMWLSADVVRRVLSAVGELAP